jgi:DNA-binding CsgD family transcriptional regulator
MGQEYFEGRFLLGELTVKQREVLDLLIEHKTSKEIARLLRISPHTVDQRIQFAKDKLGARSRNEAAAVYRRLLETYGQVTHENSYVAYGAAGVDNGDGTQGPLPERSHWERTRSAQPASTEADYQVVPELFDGRYGTLVRLGAIISIAVLLVILVLGGLAIFSQLSELMAT